MPAVISKNTNYAAGLGGSIVGNDSGNIVVQNAPGVAAAKLTDGTQQSATTLACDSGVGVTAGYPGNFIPATYQKVVSATITNLALTSNVVTITAANTFAAGDLVTLAGLTHTAALNGKILTVLAGGLSGSSFTANLTNADIVSAAETGTATAPQTQTSVQTAAAGYSLAPEHE
jgi:hypothetical protein